MRTYTPYDRVNLAALWDEWSQKHPKDCVCKECSAAEPPLYYCEELDWSEFIAKEEARRTCEHQWGSWVHGLHHRARKCDKCERIEAEDRL